MAAPSRESTGRLVTDSTFTLPYAYPSSADYSIESQFDDVPGPYRRLSGAAEAANKTSADIQRRLDRCRDTGDKPCEHSGTARAEAS